METPEKIYFDEDEFVLYLFSTKKRDNDVEYVRKDVFIEKACDAYCKVCKVPNCRSNECEWVEKFRKHLMR